MTLEEFQQLQSENAYLREQLVARDALLAQLVERIQQLETQLAQDSHNSSKPPSSDSYKRSPKQRSLRKKSSKTPGAQPGHKPAKLEMSQHPDQIVPHFPQKCHCCELPFSITTAPENEFEYEARQEFELPLPVKLVVTEHRSYCLTCPACATSTKAAFPPQLIQTTQYGFGLRALLVYLSQQQLLPYARVTELVAHLTGQTVSPGTVYHAVAQTAQQLEAVEERTKRALHQSDVLGSDESGVRIDGKTRWLHVTCRPTLTHYAVDTRRGAEATEDIGILPGYKGVSVHDGWASYNHYAECQHALCNAHHLRELTLVLEQLGQGWAGDFIGLLVELKEAVERAVVLGQKQLCAEYLAETEKRYQQMIEQGLAANPPPAGGWPKSGKGRGRAKKSKARNLVERLGRQRESVLRFAYRFDVPFDNNQAERDIRMVKVQQKVAGGFRSWEGARYFCRIRGYLSTLRKQGADLLDALRLTLSGEPPMPAF
jgi:transposase